MVAAAGPAGGGAPAGAFFFFSKAVFVVVGVHTEVVRCLLQEFLAIELLVVVVVVVLHDILSERVVSSRLERFPSPFSVVVFELTHAAVSQEAREHA